MNNSSEKPHQKKLKLGRVAPVWVPDQTSSQCQECNTKFSFIIRKHHCRACGRLLCNQCTKHQHPLEYLGWCPSRVCQICFGIFTKNTSEIRRTKSLNDFDDMKQTISRLIRSQQLAVAQAEKESGITDKVCHMSLLPPELISTILAYIPFEDQKECRLVCHTWLLALEVTDFYKHCCIVLDEEVQKKTEKLRTFSFSTSPFHFFSLTSFSSFSNFPLCTGFISASVQSLHLIDCEVTEKELLLMLSNLPNIKSLGLINCRELFMTGTFLANEADKANLSRSLVNLEELVLDQNTYLSDVLLLRIAGVITRIQSLSLAGCNVMNHAGIYTKFYPESQDIQASSSVLTWRIVVKVIMMFQNTLKELCMAKNGGVKIEDLCDIPDLNIEKLNITGCSTISDEAFLTFALNQTKLRKLEMANSRKIFTGLAQSSDAIFKAVKSLSEINLSENSIPYLNKMGSIENLQSLQMDSLDTPGSTILSAFQSLNTSKLHTWRARFLSMQSQDLSEIFRKCNLASLRKLDLSYSSEGVVTDAIVESICTNLPQLEHLDLSGNPGVTDIGTLGLQEDNPIATSMIGLKDLIAKDGKIILGSKHEIEIMLDARRQKFAIDILSKSNDLEVKSGLANLSRLRYIDLGGTAVTSLTLSLGLSSPDLRHLGLASCKGKLISDIGLHEAALKHPRLSSLCLRSSCVTDVGLLSCISCLPRLIHLDVRQCLALTSPGLAPLPQVVPQLQTLLISQCPGVSLDTGKHLLNSMRFLKKIDLHGLKKEPFVSSDFEF
eukprot:TRINITY_DN24879_c0_g1_i1.p1 TRINITY_DN24879_c0_g1~~TRINITY_DN24879_c0_g1_i1.p1  ORF type:complete len:778 (-),score=134.70 TRINITY_DN24879_c0_g1_i1:603-2936(-)